MGSFSVNPLDMAYQEIAVDPMPQTTATAQGQSQAQTVATPPPVPAVAPFQTRQSLMEYAQVLGTPIGTAGSLLGSLVCQEDACRRGMILTLAAVAGYYGWTRKDPIGWALMVSAGAAAVYTLFDPPKVVPAPMVTG